MTTAVDKSLLHKWVVVQLTSFCSSSNVSACSSYELTMNANIHWTYNFLSLVTDGWQSLRQHIYVFTVKPHSILPVCVVLPHLLFIFFGPQKIDHVNNISVVLLLSVSVTQNSQSWPTIFPEWSFMEETVQGIMFLDCTLAPCMSEVWNVCNVMVAWTSLYG